jgi:hypothetical protein
MNHSPVTPEERFAALVEEFLGHPGATPPSGGKGFGESTLKIRGRIFAMLVKLPRSRVDALIASGEGERFDPRHDGRLMKEWVILEPASAEEWLNLSREAMEFVAALE